jgi:hypothetical protein
MKRWRSPMVQWTLLAFAFVLLRQVAAHADFTAALAGAARGHVSTVALVCGYATLRGAAILLLPAVLLARLGLWAADRWLARKPPAA